MSAFTHRSQLIETIGQGGMGVVNRGRIRLLVLAYEVVQI